MSSRSVRSFACPLSLLALALAACTGTQDAASAASPDAQADAAPAEQARDIPVIAEAFQSTMTPDDNIDSVASWTAPDGAVWVIATAKSTDRLVVYDGHTGQTLRTVGSLGTGEGKFDRPNGVAVADDLAFVVERDNRRVQALTLPALEPAGHFGSEDLVLPYGIWMHAADGGYELYVTDAYMAGEDGEGEDIPPPLAELDQRVKRFRIDRDDIGAGTFTGAFGDTGEEGALRVVESLWGDPASGRLLVAEEDEAWANEFKVYGLDGSYRDQVFGGDVLDAQAEGIALYACGAGGWWITTAQASDVTTFHLFERESLAHVGAFRGGMVANTDGIWLQQAGTRAFPQGAFYAVHDDQGLVAFDWRDIAGALGLPDCAG